MSILFNKYSQHYNLLNSDKDYKSEIKYIRSLLENYGLRNSNVLEFGSGTGIHGKLLSESGYSVTGIEISEQMIENAAVSDKFELLQGDIRTTKLNRKYDVVISLFHVISYLIEDDDLLLTFQNANEHLNHGGFFIFDCWYSPAVNNIKPSVRVKRVQNEKIKITRLAEPSIFVNQNRVDVNYSIYISDNDSGQLNCFNETHSMRHFSIPEIALLSKYTGFEVVLYEEFLTTAIPSENTWGICFVLRKK